MEIIYEDEFIVAINKPAGISVHPDGKTIEYTVCDFVLEKYPELKDVGEPLTIEHKGEKIIIARPGIVHRLDKDTTGALLITKTQDAFLFLKAQFQNHEIKKTYHACVYGSPKETEGVIDQPIGRSKDSIRKWATGKNVRGTIRDAKTLYKVLSVYGGESGKGSTEEGVFSYLLCTPLSGRTHQIRVHLRHINHPIVGDTLYAPKRPLGLGFERLALHARAISFKTPDEIIHTVEAPYPNDFLNARIAMGL